MRRIENAFLVLSLIAVALLITECRRTGSGQINGTIRLADRTYLPEGSIIMLRLMDGDQKGSDALILEKRLVVHRTAPAFTFLFPVEGSVLSSGTSFLLHASLQVNGQLTHTGRQQWNSRYDPATDSIRLLLHPQ